ncbi:MAG TPA: NfeD family protein [Solirubrobacterales bacterium]|jgi:membrane-bound serine protease (ClpP class)|nr:NfeD family protein [Solirubrobacterales bacterium]
MEAFVIVALVGFVLLLAELSLPTGGALAALGVVGLIAGGVLALESDSSVADYVGPALITLGVLSGISFYFVTRKVIEAHRDQPVRTGTEELIGSSGEARSTIDPEGQVWLAGTIWGARLANGSGPVRLGDRVTVEAVDGLTLVIRAQPPSAETSKEGSH